MTEIYICAIMKNNYEYINEWVNHYLSLGATKIIIYDNNDISDKRKIKVDNMSNLIIIDWRGIYSGQLSAYEDCYKRFSNCFEWIGYFDSDEYLILNKWKSLQEMLYEFNENDLLAINWLNYDDMDIIHRDERIPVNKFFTRIAKRWNDFYHYKQFIRCGLENIEIHQHFTLSLDSSNNLKRTNIVHEDIPIDEYLTYHFHSEAFIKHVLTKTLDEYIKEKAFNGKPTGRDDRTGESTFGYFFDVNNRTPAKEKRIKEFLEDREKRLKVTYLLNPSLNNIKKYSEGKYDIVITSNEYYKTFFNRPSRILIMNIKDASKRYPKMKIIK